MKVVTAIINLISVACLMVIMSTTLVYADIYISDNISTKQELTKSDYGVLQRIRFNSLEGVLH